ncbi:hypothetical protein LJB42_002945 [Komagataella kurtzmanii]|nr:hypothetical protein LJB42_002945 [Komagataella kurtzmanii]
MSDNEGYYGVTQKRNIRRVRLGDNEFDTLYGNSVYFLEGHHDMLGYEAVNAHQRIHHRKHSEPQINGDTESYWLDTLYVCDLCFKYTRDEALLNSHLSVCKHNYRFPGKTMYKDNFTIKKVSGYRHTILCQNLCLFAKLFLDSKSVYFSIENFDFYVVLGESNGRRVPMGFFSKELLSWDENNLACILIFPPFQRKRLGHLLIEFSYELSRFEGKVSGPEFPLSAFGKIGYLKYWSKVICRELLYGRFRDCQSITLQKLSKFTCIRVKDLISTLDYMGSWFTTSDIENSKSLDQYPLAISRSVLKQWIKGESSNCQKLIQEDSLVLY